MSRKPQDKQRPAAGRRTLGILSIFVAALALLAGALAWGFAQFTRPGPLEKDVVRIIPRGAGVEAEFHFEKGAGHWWNHKETKGADCVDWVRIFDLFRAARISRAPSKLAFVTVDPVVDADHHWVHVAQPREYGRPARIKAGWDAASRTVTAETDQLPHPPDVGTSSRRSSSAICRFDHPAST